MLTAVAEVEYLLRFDSSSFLVAKISVGGGETHHSGGTASHPPTAWRAQRTTSDANLDMTANRGGGPSLIHTGVCRSRPQGHARCDQRQRREALVPGMD